MVISKVGKSLRIRHAAFFSPPAQEGERQGPNINVSNVVLWIFFDEFSENIGLFLKFMKILAILFTLV